MSSCCILRLRMPAYSARVALVLAALLVSLQPSHGFTPGTSTPAPNVSCLSSDCNYPTVQANFESCFDTPPDSCPSATQPNSSHELIPYNGLITIATSGYQNNKYCVWNLGPTSTCKYSYVFVATVDMGPREPGLTCTHSYDSSCCQCRDHVLVNDSGREYCLVDNECPFPPIFGDLCCLNVHGNPGDLTVSYRSDAQTVGDGFLIWVYIDFGTLHDCGEAQDVDFDIKQMPHLYNCPSLTHDQLVAKVVRFSDEVLKNISHTASKDPLILAHVFSPPHAQCYCFGTCTARSAMHRLEIMTKFATQPSGFSSVSYLNSPDAVLRKAARASAAGKLPQLQL